MNYSLTAVAPENEIQKINGFTQNKRGFSLIELLVVIAIVGFLTTTFVTMFRKTSYERDQFIVRLNTLTALAWQEALMTGKIHRLFFDMGKRTIVVERATNQKDKKGFPIFEPLKQQLTSARYQWPASIQFKQFMLQGSDELRATGGKGTIWFAIVPEGLSQEVTINAVDAKDKVRGKPRQFGLVLNPFTVQFKEYSGFQK